MKVLGVLQTLRGWRQNNSRGLKKFNASEFAPVLPLSAPQGGPLLGSSEEALKTQCFEGKSTPFNDPLFSLSKFSPTTVTPPDNDLYWDSSDADEDDGGRLATLAVAMSSSPRCADKALSKSH